MTWQVYILGENKVLHYQRSFHAPNALEAAGKALLDFRGPGKVLIEYMGTSNIRTWFYLPALNLIVFVRKE